MTIRLPHRGWLFDLDGTIYLGDSLIPGADRVIAALRDAGRRVAFLSNKPLYTRTDYAEKLTRLGIPATPDDVVNSSIVLARHLATLDRGAPVFVIGEPPLIAELGAHGFEVRHDHHVRWSSSPSTGRSTTRSSTPRSRPCVRARGSSRPIPIARARPPTARFPTARG